MATGEGNTVFLLMITGQIETLEFPEYDDIYCRYHYAYGRDWDITSGLEEGLTQTAKKSYDERNIFVLNFPIDIGFKSTNPFGWPRIAVHAYGYDIFGNDVIRGYGMVHVPISPGWHIKKIPLFVPISSSQFQQFIAWLTSRKPELTDPRIVTESEGRENMRVKSQGSMTLSFNIVTKNFKNMGYEVSSSEPEKVSSLMNNLTIKR